MVHLSYVKHCICSANAFYLTTTKIGASDILINVQFLTFFAHTAQTANLVL
jgi:hypothetical protein